jgi:hypothetical protein
MLEPSEASQKVRNTDTFRGAHAPEYGVSCDMLSTLFSPGLFIGARPLEHKGERALPSVAGQVERNEDQ